MIIALLLNLLTLFLIDKITVGDKAFTSFHITYPSQAAACYGRIVQTACILGQDYTPHYSIICNINATGIGRGTRLHTPLQEWGQDYTTHYNIIYNGRWEVGQDYTIHYSIMCNINTMNIGRGDRITQIITVIITQ